MNSQIMSRESLEHQLDTLGENLTKKCNEEGGGIVFICIMKGGFMFFSDLIQRIKYPIEVDFITCSSYEDKERKPLEIHSFPSADIKDKTVYLIDDILDSGSTMKSLISYFERHGAKSIETVSAVYKENVDFPHHYYIYKQPENVNPWYVGYGMDGPKGYSRNLNTINIL